MAYIRLNQHQICVTVGYRGKAKSCIGAWVQTVLFHSPFGVLKLFKEKKKNMNVYKWKKKNKIVYKRRRMWEAPCNREGKKENSKRTSSMGDMDYKKRGMTIC